MRMLHRAALACLTALFLAASVSPGLAQEEILDWHSDIEVHEDGSMTVTETIRVRAEGNQIKRGIYRDFPTKYKDRAGNRVTVDFSLLGVERDGRPEPHHTKDLSNGVRIYAGSSNVFLDPGEYRYRITYRTDRQLGYFDEHDELYWNVTGNGWAFPIRQASAAVTLPPTVPAQSLRMTGYTGPQGSREQALTWETDSSGRTVYRSSRPLAPKEGLTIVLGWEKGHIAEPGRAERTVFWITDNMTSAAAVAGLVLLLLYYLWAWRRAGKDPEKGTVIPLFEPPDNLSPAAMRYIMEMGFDNRAFAAAVITLAVKGSLTITDEPRAFVRKEYTLHKREEEPKVPLSKGEQKVLKKLFPGLSNTLVLENKNHKRISGAIEALKGFLKEEYHKTAFVNNSGYIVTGFLISVVIAFLMGMMGGFASGPPVLFIILWFVPWTAATLFLWVSRKFAMAVMFSFFLVAAGAAFTRATSAVFMASLVLLVFFNIVFHNLLKAPTRRGRRIMDRVEGFRMFLSTAEEHRLNQLHPPEKTPELFERYLPFALALEVDQEWSEKFADVLSRSVADNSYHPGWYQGRHWNSMDAGRFASDLGSSLSSAISSASSAPGSSSGFGGGGGSGGGGGGGGGGGW